MQMTVTEARRRWGELLDRVERGEAVSVSRRGRVVATFLPELRMVQHAPPGEKNPLAERAAHTE